jgi:hypothetical protein
MVEVIQLRSAQGKATDIEYHGIPVDKKKLRRMVTKEVKGILDPANASTERPPINIISMLYVNWIPTCASPPKR